MRTPTFRSWTILPTTSSSDKIKSGRRNNRRQQLSQRKATEECIRKRCARSENVAPVQLDSFRPMTGHNGPDMFKFGKRRSWAVWNYDAIFEARSPPTHRNEDRPQSSFFSELKAKQMILIWTTPSPLLLSWSRGGFSLPCPRKGCEKAIFASTSRIMKGRS